jgi:hypothetical protein
MNNLTWEEMSNKELKNEILELYDLIYGENLSYSSHDLINYDNALAEAHKRNLKIKVTTII